MPGFKSLGAQFQTDIVSDQVAPPWLQNPVGSAYLQTLGQGLDSIRYRSAQSSLIHMPGQGDSSADYYIGLDRLLMQGQGETSAAFEARCSAAFDSWQRAGNDWSVIAQTMATLQPYLPAIRTVSDTVRWSWYNENGFAPQTPPSEFLASVSNWNWDNEDPSQHPLSPTAWWRFWLIVNAGMSIAGTSINGATFASPIEFSTTTAHGLSIGQTVYIDQVSGNLGANGGPFVVDPANYGASTFSLTGVNGTGIWTGGGYVYAPDANNWVAPFPCLGTPGSPCLGVSTYGIPISGATNASPVVYTTSVAHGLHNGDRVYVNEITGNLAANTSGIPYVVTTGTTFTFQLQTLAGAPVNGSGAYTGGGYVFTVGGQPSTCLGMQAVGSNVPVSSQYLASLLSQLQKWKTAHATLSNVIVTFDSTLFVQDTPIGATQPDGTFAYPAKLVGGVYVPARYTNARYVGGVT